MRVLFLGAGYCAEYTGKFLSPNVKIFCTHRSKELLLRKASEDKKHVSRFIFSDLLKDKELFSSMTHILISIPPDNKGDFVIREMQKTLSGMSKLVWLGYFSTTGVYGDHNGAWVDEDSELKTQNVRSINRIKAENQYLKLYKDFKTPIHIFRLPGIYGPERSIFERLKDKDFRMVVKKDHFFSRVHVSDIASAINLSMLGTDSNLPKEKSISFLSKSFIASSPCADLAHKEKFVDIFSISLTKLGKMSGAISSEIEILKSFFVLLGLKSFEFRDNSMLVKELWMGTESSSARGVGLIPLGPLINNSSFTKYLNLFSALLIAG